MTPLTDRQRDVYDFIKTHIAENRGTAPTYEKIAAAMQLKSLATVFKHIHALEEKGWIKHQNYGQQSISLCVDSDTVRLDFILGACRIAHGAKDLRSRADIDEAMGTLL